MTPFPRNALGNGRMMRSPIWELGTISSEDPYVVDGSEIPNNHPGMYKTTS